MDEWANDPTFCDMAQLMGVELDSMDFEQVKQLFDSWDHGRHTLHGPKLEEESLLFGYFISPKIDTPRGGKPHSGHEVCVWPYKGGIAALLTTDGPEKNTIQYAPDGFNFEIVAVLKGAPEAFGVYRSEDPNKRAVKINHSGGINEQT